MPTSQALAKQIELAQDEIKKKEKALEELRQKHKVQESKEQTQRRIDRAKILENLIEESDKITDEQLKSFLEKTITSSFALKILTQLKEQNAVQQATSQDGNGEDEGEKPETVN